MKLIRVNGTEERIFDPDDYIDDPLDIYLPDHVMIIEEFGFELPINRKASALARMKILGDVVLIEKEEIRNGDV